MIGATVELSEFEQAVARRAAQLRTAKNRKEGVKNSRVGEQADDLTDLEGVGSEMAFCKLFNLYPDSALDVSPRSSGRGEDAGDAEMPDGGRVDVKATRYPNGKLLAVPWKNPEGVDVFALLVGTFPRYTFKGFMGKGELMSGRRLGSLGHGQTYIATQGELVEYERVA